MNNKTVMIVMLLGFCSLGYACQYSPSSDEIKESKELIEYAQAFGPFQDIIVNNQILFKSSNSDYCQQRYAFIKAYIKAWCKHVNCKQKLTMIDCGAAQGYFSFQLAHELRIKSVMVEDGRAACTYDTDHIDYLLRLCKLNKSCETMVLVNPIDAPMLQQLNLWEHFNIVLALNVLHYLKDWQECLTTMLELGDLIFVEVPVNNDNTTLKAIHTYVKGMAIKKDQELFVRPSGKKTIMYVFAKKTARNVYDGITFFTYIQSLCKLPEIKQAALEPFLQNKKLAPQEVKINYHGDVFFPRGIHGSDQIRSML